MHVQTSTFTTMLQLVSSALNNQHNCGNLCQADPAELFLLAVAAVTGSLWPKNIPSVQFCTD